MTVQTISARWLYFNGIVLSTAGYVGEFDPPERRPHTTDRTGPFNTRPTRSLSGYEDVGDMTFSVWAERDLVTLIAALHAGYTANTPVCYGIATDTAGQEFSAIQALHTVITPSTDPMDVHKYTVTFQPNKTGIEVGEIVHALAEESGDGDSESSSVDSGAQTTAGGSAYVQVTAVNRDSGTALQFTQRDSPDDAAWSDLVAFTAIAADYADSDPDTGTGERVAISGTIERYLAIKWDFTGSPSGSEDTTFWNGVHRS